MTLIDKEELLNTLRQRYKELNQWYKDNDGEGNESRLDIISSAIAECFEIGNIIKNTPTIDAVPVIHCKDCEHLVCGSECYCGETGMVLKSYEQEEHFCSFGVRKNETN